MCFKRKYKVYYSKRKSLKIVRGWRFLPSDCSLLDDYADAKPILLTVRTPLSIVVELSSKYGTYFSTNIDILDSNTDVLLQVYSKDMAEELVKRGSRVVVLKNGAKDAVCCVLFGFFLLKKNIFWLYYCHSLYVVIIMNILDLIFPKKCVGCGQMGEYLCPNCKRTLQPHMEICPCCHRYSKDYQTCVDCKSMGDFVLDGILIPFSYSGFLKKIVLKLKYYHKRDVVDFLIDRVRLAIYANHTLNSKIEKGNVIVSGIPSHWYRRYFTKGYNQSFLLAKNLAKKLDLPYGEFLKKVKKTKSQASLDREGRLKNLKNVFSFKNEGILENIQTIILVDDVTTTGSTLNEVAKFIKSKYPRACIWGVVLCRKTN